MKYVGYIRVSTDAQADGQGLAVQEDEIRAWAKRKRHQIVHLEYDVGRSGADDVAQRPGLARALAHLAQERAGGLVVARLDRLARDMVLQEMLVAELHKHDLAIHSTVGAEDHLLIKDATDPTRALVRRILGAVSQYERDLIRLRLRSGRDRKALGGGYIGGTPPYGYRTVGGELAPREDEQAGLALMRRLRAEGSSLETIARALDKAGHKPRRGELWARRSVSRIVDRQTNLPRQGKVPAKPIVGGVGVMS